MRSLLASMFVLTTAALASPAVAGGYVSLGLGDAADLRGDFAARYQTDSDSDANSGRIGVGQRFGPLAVEANIMGSDVGTDRTYTLGVDLKYHYGLGGGLELVGKAGLGKTWLNLPSVTGDGDLSGRSKRLGGGLQYGFRSPIGQMAIWADYTREYLELANTSDTLDGELDMLQIGLTVGL